MRLLDPFAGVQLADGVAVMHLALYGASNMCFLLDKDPDWSREVTHAWLHLRHAHIAVFVLQMISYYCNREEKLERNDVLDQQLKIDQAKTEKEKLKIKYQNNNFRMALGQFCSVVSVFLYTLVVFQAQLALSDKLKNCFQNPEDVIC